MVKRANKRRRPEDFGAYLLDKALEYESPEYKEMKKTIKKLRRVLR